LAKLERDPRYRGYSHPYIVELDALVAYAPSEFRRLVHKAIEEVWDEELYEKLKERMEEIRDEIDKLLSETKEKAKQKILDDLRMKE